MSGAEELRVLDLFSGIGGFSLGLETISDGRLLRNRPVCAESTAQALASGPADRRYSETQRLIEAAAQADVIVGGFPCQDISTAGKGAGIDGARSGLWGEMRRTIGLVRPRFAIVENVPGLLSGDGGRWFHRILGDLAALGYDAEWHCIPASAAGAPHRRDRVWIIAYSPRERCGPRRAGGSNPSGAGEREQALQGHSHAAPLLGVKIFWDESNGDYAGGGEVAAADGNHQLGRRLDVQMGRVGQPGDVANAGLAGRTQWAAEPDVGRVADGVPARVDRLRCLGNAIVPEIIRRIGRAIVTAKDNSA